ncbi:Peptidase propeptide and YPEB domain-containing protein [Halobacillus alkaliphilus]|uniref:Peptidase propeptide and YPEB domain-containing protein n=1 Tax=Halobacillus alkaliphilus TaxID=396056 RepID=A0A1I2LKF4_9BACI|nr:PepSY domain-containing protein [Halobacillus alkaliphilus]SFF79755.1 Peptidase propeptide and YPEB domain-containing protein [Halobacillus alkaliphilus]
MDNKLKKRVLITIGICAAVAFISWASVRYWMGQNVLSAEEVRAQIQSQYKGEITNIEKVEDRYLVALQLETGTYRLEMAEGDGRIIRMDRTGEPSPANDEPANPESPDETENKQPITEEQARGIALERVNGEIDDVDYESSEEGPYFLIEVELDDDREATIQVHAITGEIMTVSWND